MLARLRTAFYLLGIGFVFGIGSGWASYGYAHKVWGGIQTSLAESKATKADESLSKESQRIETQAAVREARIRSVPDCDVVLPVCFERLYRDASSSSLPDGVPQDDLSAAEKPKGKGLRR